MPTSSDPIALSFASEGDGVTTWTWEVTTGAVHWSDGIDALFGLPRGGFGGTYEAYLALVHPDDRAHFQALIARTLAGEDEYVMSHRVIWPDGSDHWIDGRGRLTRTPDGKPLRLEGVAWNATERKRAARKLTHLQRVQAVAFAVSRELLRVRSDAEAFDHACRIAVEHGHFHFAWVGLLAPEGDRVIPVARAGKEDGYLDETAVVAELVARGRGPVGRAIREGERAVVNDIEKDWTFEPWRDAAVARGYRGCAALPLRRGSQVIGALSIYSRESDRFDEPQLELLRSLTDDISFALDAIDQAARRRAAEEAMRRTEQQLMLADRLASLGRLAAGVAHEVNNPLAYLVLNLERIQRATGLAANGPPALLAEIRDATTHAQDGAGRVRAVVRALGALGRDEEMRIGAVELERVIDSAVRLAENRARHRGRIVKRHGSTRFVRGDELRLAQVFLNLLVNAADALEDHAAETNEVVVTSFDQGPNVVVEIKDNGRGIQPALLGRIFDPFFTTKAVGEGTGLGLAISYGILSSFGASVSVESTVGEGSVFRVTLVAADAARDAPPPPKPSRARPADAGVRPPDRARVLVVDDEPNLGSVIASSLDAHDVTIALTAREALELCASTAYDCVLCDLMMPGMSGIELHAELTKLGLGSRVVFMTGGAFTERAKQFVASVPNLVLEKPFTVDRLERAVASTLEATAAARTKTT